MLINYDRFVQTEYGDKSVISESKFMTTRFSATVPSFIDL